MSFVLLVASLTVAFTRKNIIQEVPKEQRLILLVRSLFGIVAFTALLYSTLYIPLVIITIVVNTAPFYIAILGYIINREHVSIFTAVCIAGCFGGIIVLCSTNVNSDSNVEIIIDDTEDWIVEENWY